MSSLDNRSLIVLSFNVSDEAAGRLDEDPLIDSAAISPASPPISLMVFLNDAGDRLVQGLSSLNLERLGGPGAYFIIDLPGITIDALGRVERVGEPRIFDPRSGAPALLEDGIDDGIKLPE